MRKRPLLWFACVFLCGLAFGKYENIFMFYAFLLCIGIEIYHGVRHSNVWKLAGRSIVLLSVFLLGMWHMKTEENFRARYMSILEQNVQFIQNKDEQKSQFVNRKIEEIFSKEENVSKKETGFQKKLDQTVLVWGEIIKIENTDYGIRMILSDCYISLNEEKIPCNDIMVYASSNHFHVGEIHKIEGQLNLFEHARNQGNFDSRIFYQSQKIDFSMQLESSTFLGKNENVIQQGLLVFKESLQSVYESCMNESSAGFYTGMLLGDKTGLEDEIKDLFERGGISHILAISGLHVSMIGRNCYTILRKCGLSFLSSGVFAGSLLLAYGYLVGNGMSAVRAIGMMLIFFVGQYIGRSYDMLNALGAMVLLLLWENPFLLEYSGFWFSIMALLGVGFVGDAISRYLMTMQKNKRVVNFEGSAFRNLRSFGWIQSVLSCIGNRKIWNTLNGNLGMSLGITLTTLPVVAYCYYEVPLYSPIINAIALPLLAPIFLLALCGGLMGLKVLAWAKIMLIPCSWGLDFYIWICEFAKKLPLATIICGKPKVGIIVLYYVLLACFVLILRQYEQKIREYNVQSGSNKSMVASKIFTSSLILLCLIIYPKENPCEITFLDVGQGDGIYISTGDGVSYFIDGGSSSVKGVGEYRILPFLKYNDIDCIDYWFVSHADEDHISGLIEVMENGYKVRILVLSKYVPKDESYDRLLSAARGHGVKVVYMNAGDSIQTKNSKIECLYPYDGSAQDKNDASMVLELEICMMNRNYMEKTYKFLFAGDISSEVEKLLVQANQIEEVWLYKASHHGSKYSNSEEMLHVLCPEVVVISCGKNNIYGHPHIEVLDRLNNIAKEVFQTQYEGQITFKD